MLKVAYVVGLAIIVPFLLLFVFFIVSMRLKNVRDDRAPFECGFDPKGTARIPFSLRFFLLAVVFLIFDVEVALLFPLLYSLFNIKKTEVLVSSTVFLALVTFGLFMEWKGGALDWV